MSVCEMPLELAKELVTMRRNPANFTVVRRANCKLGDEQTYVLTHPGALEAGSWCEVHGWIYFSSGALLPEWE